MRLMVVIEAASVTGPAKNLIDFFIAAREMAAPLEPLVVTFRRAHQGAGEFETRIREAGIEFRAIGEKGSFDAGVMRELRGIANQWGPDLIQTHAVKSHLLVALSGCAGRSAWVAFHHGYTFTDLKMRLYNELDRWSLRRAARLVTVSEAFKRQLVSRGVSSGNIDVLQNAVDAEWTRRVQGVDGAAVRREWGWEGCQIILAVGRMSREKAHSDLIEAFHLLRAENPLARLLLVGEGPERKKLEASAGEGVIFVGQQRDVSRYFAVADVMVLPSLTEGSPNVLLESMACGVPSVATTVGGVPEIVSDGREALLVPPRKPVALAAAIGRVLSQPGLRAELTARARETIRVRHSTRTRAETLMRIYREIAARRSGRGLSVL